MALILHPHLLLHLFPASNLSLSDSHRLPLCSPLMFCMVPLFTVHGSFFSLAASLSPVCLHTFVPHIPLCPSVSLYLSCFVSPLQVFHSHTVRHMARLFYFNLTLLLRNRHPHVLAILLAPFHFIYSLLFLLYAGYLPCYVLLHFSLF